MAKRIGVVLSGCGWGDGSDAAETMLAMLCAERAGATIICAAPDRDQRTVLDHLSGGLVAGVTRNARVEAARLSGGPVMPLGELREVRGGHAPWLEDPAGLARLVIEHFAAPSDVAGQG